MNQAFNIDNRDLLRWGELWAHIATTLDVDSARVCRIATTTSVICPVYSARTTSKIVPVPGHATQADQLGL